MHDLIIGSLEKNNSHYIKNGPQIPSELNISQNLVKISEISDVNSINTGKDHLVVLLKNGDCYGMGDDSFGQLGLGTFTEERQKQMKTHGNFLLRRKKKPKKILVKNIKKVACGDNLLFF